MGIVVEIVSIFRLAFRSNDNELHNILRSSLEERHSNLRLRVFRMPLDIVTVFAMVLEF